MVKPPRKSRAQLKVAIKRNDRLAKDKKIAYFHKKENDNYEDARVTNSEKCGQSALDNKQEIKCKTWKAGRDALITENEKKGLESQKIEQQEEMKKDKKEKEYLC